MFNHSSTNGRTCPALWDGYLQRSLDKLADELVSEVMAEIKELVKMSNKIVQVGGTVGGSDGLRVGLKVAYYPFMSPRAGRRFIQVTVGQLRVVDEEFIELSRPRAVNVLEALLLETDPRLMADLIQTLLAVSL